MKNRILIVDDEKPFLRSLIIGLSDRYSHYEILYASNGREAVETLDAGEVDVLVTDLKMPEMGGYELIAYMNKHYPKVPVILMTAYGSPALEENFRLLGVFRYIEKPIDFKSFSECIDIALSEVRTQEKTTADGSASDRLVKLLRETIQDGTDGEVVVRHGSNNGRIFVTDGRIAWVATTVVNQTFITYLLNNTHLAKEELKDVFMECKRLGKNFGETIIEWNMIERDALRTLLLEYISISFKPILSWKDTEIMFVPENRVYQSTLVFELDDILGSIEHITDTVSKRPVRYHSEPIVSLSGQESTDVLRHLERFNQIDGFLMAGVFSCSGRLFVSVPKDHAAIENIGCFANEVLVEAQNFSEAMDVGRGNFVHIESGETEILMRCYNEGEDQITVESGKVHFHTALVIDKQANVGLAKILLDKVTIDIAPFYRYNSDE